MARRIKQQHCANCSYAFNKGENFCPNCGQENHSPNQPIKHYTSELVESLLHLDSKILLTIGTLIRYPGKITREYNDNMRARYTPPIRLYVFASLIFFVLIQFYPIYNNDAKRSHDAVIKLDDTSSIKAISESGIKKSSRDSLQDEIVIENLGGIKLKMTKGDFLRYKNATQQQIDSFIIAKDFKPNYFSRTLLKQIIKSANSDEIFVNRLKEKAIKFGSFSLFFLMPFFGLLVSFIYFRRKKFYYEYLIFSIHYHTIIFIILSLIAMVNIFIEVPAWLYGIAAIGFIYYLLKALRFNFQGSRIKTIMKTAFICSIYTLTLLLVLFAVVILGWWFV